MSQSLMTCADEAVPAIYQGELTPFALSTMAASILIEEAELTPKPALVDRRGRGAHYDLDLIVLRRSALSLRPGFIDIARVAAVEKSPLRVREEIGQIGRDMEQRMLDATGGSNAHRGAIWALGLLVAAVAMRSDRSPHRIATVAASLAQLPDQFAPNLLTNGEKARLRFGATGARAEAQAGFPHAIQFGLPMLRTGRLRGVSEDCARLDALMAIMARLDDTCLLHRGGMAALQAAKRGASAVLATGGTAMPAGRERLHRLHEELMTLWASPGGSADLLGVTLFLDRLEVESTSDESEGDLAWKH
jgi:triphosphoribosyl-dephospho-CoA synthase